MAAIKKAAKAVSLKWALVAQGLLEA